MTNTKRIVLPVLACVGVLLFSQMGFCSVESSLQAVQSKLIGTVLPLLAILGLVMAGFSFVMGSQNARSHLILAIIGATVGFGAPSIVSFIRGMIN